MPETNYLHNYISPVRLRRITALIPGRCLLCRSATHKPLCDECNSELPPLGHACPRCAEPMPRSELCGRCQQNKRSAALHCTLSPLRYEWPTDYLVQRFKFQSDLAAGRSLAEQLASAARFHMADQRCRPDLLLPMPLHGSRRRHRGFNQSAELALQLGYQLGIPAALSVAQRVRATTTQSLLPAAQRAGNLRGAFAVDAAVAGLHVAIIDDVMTTGSSVIELANAARRAGAKQVDAWVATRAPAPGR